MNATRWNARVFVMLVFAAAGGLLMPGSDAGAQSVANGLVCAEDNGSIALPDGFCAAVFADDLGRLRHIDVRENGDVYVIHREATDAGGVTALRDTDGDGTADRIETFGDVAGTGLDIHEGSLYVSTDTSVHRWDLPDDQLIPSGSPELIVAGFPDQGSHAAKSIAFDDSGHLYVNVGGPSNACQEESRTPSSPGQDPCPQLERQASIWQFDADVPGQTHMGGHQYATGIRNAVAIAFNPADDHVYVVQHGRDQLHHLWSDLYTEEQSAELPAEELLRLTDGADFGWPYCYYDQLQEQKVLAPEYGGDGEEVGRCADVPEPVEAFPGHYAPNGLVFYTADQFPQRYHNGAFIAFHGSWNRTPLPQQGYQVGFVPMDASGQPTGDWETFADEFKGTETLENPGDAEFRPMGLALGPDGSLYVTDSVQGRIWLIHYAADR